MERGIGFVFAALALAAGVLAPTAPASAIAGFGDVAAGAYYVAPIQWMVDNGITTGTSQTCFSPNDPVSRGQAATFLFRMEGSPAGSPPHSFIDVLFGYQQDPVSWMVANSITTGTSPTTYSPDDLLTRGQFGALLYRLAGEPASPGSTFPDVVESWQQAPVAWMVAMGITTGTSSTTFSPDATVTRGQLATFLYRYKGSPAVTVDPIHPNSPACEDQVAGPTSTTSTTAPPVSKIVVYEELGNWYGSVGSEDVFFEPSSTFCFGKVGSSAFNIYLWDDGPGQQKGGEFRGKAIVLDSDGLSIYGSIGADDVFFSSDGISWFGSIGSQEFFLSPTPLGGWQGSGPTEAVLVPLLATGACA